MKLERRQWQGGRTSPMLYIRTKTVNMDAVKCTVLYTARRTVGNKEHTHRHKKS